MTSPTNWKYWIIFNILLSPVYSVEGPAMSQNVKRSAGTLLYVCRFIGGLGPFKAGRPSVAAACVQLVISAPLGRRAPRSPSPTLGAEYDDVRAPRVPDVFVLRL